jgi:hypothetical protein
MHAFSPGQGFPRRGALTTGRTVVLMTMREQQDGPGERERRESRWARLIREAGPGVIAWGWVAGMPMHPALRSVAQAGGEARRRRSTRSGGRGAAERPAPSAAQIVLRHQAGQLGS